MRIAASTEVLSLLAPFRSLGCDAEDKIMNFDERKLISIGHLDI